MTKPLPTGGIKDDSNILLETFNLLLEKVNFEDKISHLLVVEIVFESEDVT